MAKKRSNAMFSLCNCMALRKATRRVSQFYDDKLAPAGLRVTQYSILNVVDARNEVSINDLAAEIDLDRTTTGKNLLPLQRAALVEIAPSAEDARVRVVKLTDSGRAALKRAAPLWREAQREFERQNGVKNAKRLRETLEALTVGD